MFFVVGIVDRCSHHLDHCNDRDSELVTLAAVCPRISCCCADQDGQYSRNYISFVQSGFLRGIAELITQGLLDSRFAGAVSGYSFSVSASGSDYTVVATPTSTNAGRFGYYSTPDAVIRYATATSATCNPCYPPNLSGAPVQ